MQRIDGVPVTAVAFRQRDGGKVTPMLRSLLLSLVLSAAALAQVPATPAPQPPPARPLPHEWMRGAVFYEISVRSFTDSNGDGIGDLAGATSKLDYLNDGNRRTSADLGIDAISLVSIVSPVDLQSVEKDLGTNADFKRFVDEAHRRGMRVIVELAINHTSSDHPWFIESASSPRSKKRDWYVWRTESPGWRQPVGETPAWHPRGGAFYYGAFGAARPDLNYENPAVRAEMLRVARHWLAQGVDGFRLDGTRYLVETGAGEEGQVDTDATHAVLKELVAGVQRVRPHAAVLGGDEAATGKRAAYFGSLSTSLNHPLASAILESMAKGVSRPIPTTLQEMLDSYPKNAIDAPFLTRHGQPHAAAVVPHRGRLRIAATILLTMSGAPFIRAGDELGLKDALPLMPWKEVVEEQTKDAASLLSHYRALIAVRRQSPSLAKGWVQPTDVSSRVVMYTRLTPEETVLVVHNIGEASFNVPLAIGASRLAPMLVDKGVGIPNTDLGTWTAKMQPHTTAIWKAE